jgi:UDP-N-acetylmuramoyl-L-alanyl-D-glutamate--2,6-diaminopimelate ligase
MSGGDEPAPESWSPANRGLTLREIERELGARSSGLQISVASEHVRVTGVQQDSRNVAVGDLFVARRGAQHDGARYVREALVRGARAVLLDSETPIEVPDGFPVLRAPDLARVLPFIADAVYGHPAFALEVVGITGTNGKTTTSHLIREGIDAASGRASCAIVGTLGQKFGAEGYPTTHTTPEPDELSRIFRAMKQRGAHYLAMEVSSIALELGRTLATRFRVGVFTNFTQDHLDFHGTMQAYGAAKVRLFHDYAPAVSVLNIDDAFVANLSERLALPVLKVAASTNQAADIALLCEQSTSRGTALRYRTPSGTVELETQLIGSHNAENIAVALGVAQALELDVQHFARGIAESAGVPGRLERCDIEGDDIVVLVDYAHTPDALARALAAVRSAARLVCVFGCGGDRDRAKRSPMGRAAGLGCDLAIVTSDNPRSEVAEAIAEPITEGLRSAGVDFAQDASAAGYLVELDRARAIEAAILSAHPGDRILIAGKGHEDYQIIGTEKRPFDDRVVARRVLAERRSRLG